MDVKSTPVGKTESERWAEVVGKEDFLKVSYHISWVSRRREFLEKGRRALNQVQRCQETRLRRL